MGLRGRAPKPRPVIQAAAADCRHGDRRVETIENGGLGLFGRRRTRPSSGLLRGWPRENGYRGSRELRRRGRGRCVPG